MPVLYGKGRCEIIDQQQTEAARQFYFRWRDQGKRGYVVNMIVMNKEELPGWTPEDVLEWLAQYKNETDHYEEILAGAFADVSNKFWWVEDNRYDYEEGTPEYEEACRITDSCRELMESLQQQIFDILEKKDGIDIPKSGHKEILAPFMERNGYCDGNGWWIPVSEDTRE